MPKIGLSDHFPTCIVMKGSFGKKHSHTTIRYRTYKNFDQAKLLEDLHQVPWSTIDLFDNIDDCLDVWYNLFNGVIDKHLPWKEKRVKRDKQPEWMTDEILQSMSQRDHFKSINDMDQYKTARNHCVTFIKEAKITYYKTCIEQNKENLKKLWKYIRELAPGETKTTPLNLIEDNNIIWNAKGIADCFNDYFSSIVQQYLPLHRLLPNFAKLEVLLIPK